MKMLRTASAALLLGAFMSVAPASAQSFGSFAGPAGSSSGAAMGSGAAGSFRTDNVRGGRPRWSDDETWRDGRRDRRERRWRHGWYGYGIGISPGSTLDRDGGYFAEGAEPPIVENGQAHYAYDRGYPYDNFGGAEGGMSSDSHRYSSAEPSCQTEWTRDRRTNQQVAVRVCRN